MEKKSLKQQINEWSIKDWLICAIYIGVICLIGFGAMHFYIQVKYAAVFTQDACGLCRSLNPQIEGCFWEMEKMETISAPYDADTLETYENWQPKPPMPN